MSVRKLGDAGDLSTWWYVDGKKDHEWGDWARRAVNTSDRLLLFLTLPVGTWYPEGWEDEIHDIVYSFVIPDRGEDGRTTVSHDWRDWKGDETRTRVQPEPEASKQGDSLSASRFMTSSEAPTYGARSVYGREEHINQISLTDRK
jgi:hypothetical protein